MQLGPLERANKIQSVGFVFRPQLRHEHNKRNYDFFSKKGWPYKARNVL